MGKVGGFLEYGREEPGYRPSDERIKDFKEVEIRPSMEDLCRQAARCMACGTPFCHTSGCPLGNIIPEFNDLVYRGRWKEALDILLATCNFPEFTGRLCPAPCEPACVLGINDDPVTIRQIELGIIETAFKEEFIIPSPPARRSGRKAAVVGSGPAGLATADLLNRLGHEVVIYDSAAGPGGFLRYGIPDFKLEKWVVDRRIEFMKKEGIVFEMGVTVGKDISCKFLMSRFDAICLAVGAREPRDLKVPGRELDGIHFAGDYLTGQNKKISGERMDCDISAEGKEVVVIGGGDTGSDCIGTVVRQGAAKVVQLEILPRPPEERPQNAPWPMWPSTLMVSSSHKEGGERRWSVNTKEFTGTGGQVRGLRCMEVDRRKDADGHVRFVDRPGTEFEVEARLVLLAMGFVGPAANRLVEELKIERDSRGNIKVDDRNMTSVEGVFAAGDMARGQSLIVRAMADGRSAARGIAAYLGAEI